MRFFYLAILLSMLLPLGCDKENDVSLLGEELEGTWLATSYTFDNVELLGFRGQNGVNEIEITFSDYNPADREGEMRIRRTDFNTPPDPPINTSYEISTSQTRMTTSNFLTSLPASTVEWDLTNYVPDDQIWLSANISGFAVGLKLRK